MPTDNVTANRNWQLPNGGNNLDHDVARLIAALQAADLDVANILSTLVLKAPTLNAALTGAPTAPTPALADNSTKIATTAWARLYFADFVGAAPAALDTIAELATALQNNPDIITQILTSLGLKANAANAALTGVPTAPTAAAGTNTTQLATTAFVAALGALKANAANAALTGVPTAPTAAAGTNTTQLATTGFVKAAIDVVLGGVSASFDTLAELAAGLSAATSAMLQKAVDNLGMTAGFTSVVIDDGTKAAGTYTPAPTGGNFRKIIANGAFILAAPTTANSYNMEIDITNGATAGAITFSGFTPRGDAYATTNAAKFKLHISKTDAGVSAVLESMP
ncbi:hypothetical protein NKI15_06865 [Mesorhizobium sp. M0862]|uniref:hypothetical protein n=1 Tax=Mesorhizobium sp. M0862 TaxID=2957015 RepID=UPI00333DD122